MIGCIRVRLAIIDALSVNFCRIIDALCIPLRLLTFILTLLNKRYGKVVQSRHMGYTLEQPHGSHFSPLPSGEEKSVTHEAFRTVLARVAFNTGACEE
jgi:hypothetical protein